MPLWDQIQASLAGLQQPFGSIAGPVDPAMQQQAANQSLMNIGASMLANNRMRPAQAFGNAILGTQEQGLQNATRALWAQQLQNQFADRKEDKERRKKLGEALGGMNLGSPLEQAYAQYDPEGMAKLEIAQNLPSPTELMKNYAFARKQGYEGDFPRFMSDIKNGGSPNIVTDVGGNKVLVNKNTGETVKTLGPTAARENTIPQAIQSDIVRTKAARDNLNSALDEYQNLTKQAGKSVNIPGKASDAVQQSRRNIQLQLKELFNLGVLNGPDLMLMNTMLFDPAISLQDGIGEAVSKGFGDTQARVDQSVTKLKAMINDMAKNKLKAAGVTEDAAPNINPNMQGTTSSGITWTVK